jgi:hypothetical protein
MRPVVRRIIISVVAAVAVAGIWWAFQAADTKEPVRRAGIETVSPTPGDLDLRQVELSADLAAGYTGMLFLDGAEIPGDDIQRVDATNKISLRPQADSPYRQLSPGRHCAAVEYWPITQGRGLANQYRWCFNLH